MDKQIQELLNYIIMVLNELKDHFNQHPYLQRTCRLMELIVGNARRNIGQGHIVDYVRDLRLLLETAIQATYLYMKHRGDQKAIESELRRREKTATIFNAKMISRIPGLHGIIKRRILRLYLKLAEYTHPTNKLVEALATNNIPGLRELTTNTIDYVTYLLLITCKTRKLSEELLLQARRYNLEKTLRYLEK